MKTYFVTFRLFNGDNNGWAFKEEKIEDYSVAIQKYGSLINQYFEKAPFVFGMIKVDDESGNRYQQIIWGEVPTPNVEPEEESTEDAEA